jgi:hypothetical protein
MPRGGILPAKRGFQSAFWALVPNILIWQTFQFRLICIKALRAGWKTNRAGVIVSRSGFCAHVAGYPLRGDKKAGIAASGRGARAEPDWPPRGRRYRPHIVWRCCRDQALRPAGRHAAPPRPSVELDFEKVTVMGGAEQHSCRRSTVPASRYSSRLSATYPACAASSRVLDISQ